MFHLVQARWGAGYWQQNMEQRCYTGSHLTAVYAIGIPGIVLLCLGIPVATLIVLLRIRDRLQVLDQCIPALPCWRSVVLCSHPCSSGCACTCSARLQGRSRFRHVAAALEFAGLLVHTPELMPQPNMLPMKWRRPANEIPLCLQEPRTAATYGFLYHQFK